LSSHIVGKVGKILFYYLHILNFGWILFYLRLNNACDVSID